MVVPCTPHTKPNRFECFENLVLGDVWCCCLDEFGTINNKHKILQLTFYSFETCSHSHPQHRRTLFVLFVKYECGAVCAVCLESLMSSTNSQRQTANTYTQTQLFSPAKASTQLNCVRFVCNTVTCVGCLWCVGIRLFRLINRLLVVYKSVSGLGFSVMSKQQMVANLSVVNC